MPHIYDLKIVYLVYQTYTSMLMLKITMLYYVFVNYFKYSKYFVSLDYSLIINLCLERGFYYIMNNILQLMKVVEPCFVKLLSFQYNNQD